VIRSRLCTQDQLRTAEYAKWCRCMNDIPRLHRKQWEFCFIAESLSELGVLRPGARGLGFGVGQEPLPSLFASYGCEVVATDIGEEQALITGWANSTEHMKTLAQMNSNGICEQGAFNRLVTMRIADMNDIPKDCRGFDFTWSSCALEHLGSLEHGLEFVRNSLDCLRPGGIAVHTTEYNVSSDLDTVAKGGTVIYRRQDIERLAELLRLEGHDIELDFDLGNGPADLYVDAPPYCSAPHLKKALWQFTATSIGLVVRKNGNPGQASAPSRQVFGVLASATASRQHAVTVNPESALTLVLGHLKMIVAPMDTVQSPHLLLDGYFEPAVSQAFARLIRPGMRVLDIGARYGYFSLLAADLAGPEGHVDAVESNAGYFGFLRQNVGLNRRSASIDLHQSLRLSHVLMDVIRAEAGNCSVEELRGLLQQSPRANVVLKFHAGRLRKSGAAPGNFLDELRGMDLNFSLIQPNGSWKRTYPEAIARSPFEMDLLLTRGNAAETIPAAAGWLQ
jgi:SAM-dependent methyltransferase